MRNTALILALAASAAMATAPSLTLAQPYDGGYQGSYQQQQDAYQQRLDQYNQDRTTYDQQQQRRWGYRDSRYVQRSNNDPCYGGSSDGSVAGGLIGALAGAAIGSNVASRHSRTEGAVLGAVAGGVIGSSIGRNSAHCDGRGYYYSYNQTVRYQEPGGYRGQSSGRYAYSDYRRQGCRLAIAPASWGGNDQARYVRVCPDSYGRYRFAG